LSALVLDLAVDPEVARRLDHLLPEPAETLRLDEVRALGTRGALRRLRSRRFDKLFVVVNDFRAQGRWASILALAMAARVRERLLVDPAGSIRPLGWGTLLARELPFLVERAWISASVRRRVARGIAAIPQAGPVRAHEPRHVGFVRTDLSPPLRAGGSLAHIQGVVGGLRDEGIEVTFVSPDLVAGFSPDDPSVRYVRQDPGYRLSRELPALAYNLTAEKPIEQALRARGVDLVYHRFGIGSYVAAKVARRLRVPFVVEFNGSEVWIADQWGEGLEHPELLRTIENRCLAAADLVVAVSEPLRDQLRAAGVPDERILINPNGVDTRRFDPSDTTETRARVREGMDVTANQVLVGFVGTFGPWHGAEALARAAVRAAAREGGARLRYLFIGDGPRRPPTERIFAEGGVDRIAQFVGLVPQERTPSLLNACDICVAPHVPNQDGTPFFGSPTKLFEYMAAGRAILASDLDQLGEVLEHDRTAWLVTPGDDAALADGLLRLAGDPSLRNNLGQAARVRAVGRHGWDTHVARILDRLRVPRRSDADR
jgi:glycosyltransferase involved in cell wall biosynthesis